jgi:hypothetical protein
VSFEFQRTRGAGDEDFDRLLRFLSEQRRGPFYQPLEECVRQHDELLVLFGVNGFEQIILDRLLQIAAIRPHHDALLWLV